MTVHEDLFEQVQKYRDEVLTLDMLLTSADIAQWRMPTPTTGQTPAQHVAELILRNEALASLLSNLHANDSKRHRRLDPATHRDQVVVLGCSVRTAKLLLRWRSSNRNLIRAIMACASRTPTRSIPNPTALALHLAQSLSVEVFEVGAELQCLRQVEAQRLTEGASFRARTLADSALGAIA